MARNVMRAVSVGLAMALLAACTSTQGHAPDGSAPTAPAAAPRPGPTGSFDVAAENAKPGTTAWTISASAAGPQNAIEGYADQISVPAGTSFRLFVSTTSPQFTATAYRMGYYGGTGARQVWQSPHVTGTVQTAQTFISATNTVECDWKPSLTVPTSGWPEGDYLIKLVAAGGQRYVPITIRSTATVGRVVLVAGVTTWQAYNGWGGYSLYGGPKKHSDSLRSRAVSFDRPYLDYGPQYGAGLFLPFDLPLVTFAEQHGVPVAYETDLEMDTHPELFGGLPGTSKGPAAIVTDAHDEYYSGQMRDTLTNARDSGVNLAFLGANDVYRHIRWGSTQLGPDRLVICYKDAFSDPIWTVDQTQTTQNWRDAPFPRPENALTGAYFQCDPAEGAYVVYDPKNWLFAGTGAVKGSTYPGLVWPEYDRVVNIPTTPHPIEVLSHSPVTCQGHDSYQESAYYTVKSGAGVFDAGTMQWVCALEAQSCFQVPVTPAGESFVRQVTLNLLQTFAQGPAGKVHPAIDNTADDQVPLGAGLGIE